MSLDKPSNLVASILKVEYRFAKNIATFTKGSTKYHRRITFTDDDYWLNIYHTPGTATFSEPKVETDHGNIFDQQLSVKMPAVTQAYIQKLENMDEIPVIIRFTYSDGLQKIMGSDKNPVIFNSNYQESKESTSDTFTFRCQATHRAYFYEANPS